jgi:hypothetical protein
MVEIGMPMNTNEYQLQVISQMQCLKRTNVSKMCEKDIRIHRFEMMLILFSLQLVHRKSVRRTGFQLASLK